MTKKFTIHCSPLSRRYPLTVHHGQWLTANGKAYKAVRITPVRRGGELKFWPVILYTFPVIHLAAGGGI